MSNIELTDILAEDAKAHGVGVLEFATEFKERYYRVVIALDKATKTVGEGNEETLFLCVLAAVTSHATLGDILVKEVLGDDCKEKIEQIKSWATRLAEEEAKEILEAGDFSNDVEARFKGRTALTDQEEKQWRTM